MTKHARSSKSSPNLRRRATKTGASPIHSSRHPIADRHLNAEEQARQYEAQLQVIDVVSRGLASKFEFQGAIDLVGDKIRVIFDAQIVIIALYDPLTKMMSFPYVYGSLDGKPQRLYVEPRPHAGFSGHVLKTGQPLIMNTSMDKYRAKYGSTLLGGNRHPQSAITMPILSGDQTIGTISLQNFYRENAFPESDVRLLTTLAANLGLAIHNAQSFDQIQTRNREIAEALEQQTATSEILRVIAESPSNVQPVLDAIAENARRLCSASMSEVYRTDGMQVYKVASSDISVDLLETEREVSSQSYPVPLRWDSTLSSRAILGRAIVHIPDMDHAPDLPEITRRYVAAKILNSVLQVPMIREGQAIGAIGVGKRDPAPFTDKQIALMKTFADQAVIAIENVRLFNETKRLLTETEQRAAELQIINSVQEGLASKLDIQSIYDLVGDKVREIFHADVTYICSYNAQEQSVYSHYYVDGDYRVAPCPLPFGQGLYTHIIRSHQPLLASEEQAVQLGVTAVPIPGNEKGMSRTFLGVPILLGAGVKGVVSVQSHRENAFDHSDMRLLQTLANSMIVALENARLFDVVQKRNREITEALEYQTATSEILQVIASSPTDIQPVLAAISENALKLCGANFSAVYNYDGKMLDMTALRNFTPQATEEIRREYPRPLTRDAGYSARSILDKKVVEVIDALNDPDVPEATRPLVAKLGFRSGLWVPMIREGAAIGAFCVARPEPGAFDEKKIKLLQTFANQATIAIENVRLFNQTQQLLKEAEQRAAQFAIINSVQEGLASKLDVQAIYDLVGDKVRDIFRAQGTAIYIFDHEKAIQHTPYCFLRQRFVIEPHSFSDIAELVRDTAQPKIYRNNVEYRAIGGQVLENSEEFRSGMYVPLMVGKEIKGMVGIASLEKENAYGDSDLRLLQTLANSMSVALENARLFDETVRQRQHFEAVVHSSPVAIVLVDPSQTVLSWNPAAEKLFGYSRDEAVGRNLDDLVANRPEIRANTEQYTPQKYIGQTFHAITRRTRKDGTMIDVELSGDMIQTDGKLVAGIVIYHDITELQQARQQAIAANEAKSAFLATMSHEIRTPMNAVIGMSNLLLGTTLNAEQREYAGIVRNSGDALLTIINDILDFSKIEAGKMELEFQPFDLRDCVESALDLVTTTVNEKVLDLAYLIDENVPAAIIGDATRLRQILLNLLSNAVKFTEKGEVVLSVSSDEGQVTKKDLPLLPGTGHLSLYFSVRDTGIGIPRDRIDRLFQSFSQVDASTSRKYGGTGLGLAISKRLAELMGGVMSAESEGVGKGSTFHFTIHAPAATNFVRESRALPVGEQSQLRGKRILIVDDNATNRRILARQTQLWGMVSRNTETPSEALAWIERGERFDVAILDMQMPGMDGITLSHEIRAHENLAKLSKLSQGFTPLPLILASSLGRREIASSESLFAGHLAKPIKLSALFEALIGVFAKGEPSTRPVPTKPQIDPMMATRLPLRILLAEDNAVNQKLALRILSQMGYRADVAGNGIEAIEAVQRQEYDVIFMDVQMPEMDGLEATRLIKRSNGGHVPRIIAMTANATQGDREMCLAAGMDDYIAKPIRVDEIVSALNRAAVR